MRSSHNGLWATSYTNVSPRLGFAIQLLSHPQLVLRGGYGIYYDRMSGDLAEQTVGQPPFSFKQSLQGVQNAGASLQEPYSPALPPTFQLSCLPSSRTGRGAFAGRDFSPSCRSLRTAVQPQPAVRGHEESALGRSGMWGRNRHTYLAAWSSTRRCSPVRNIRYVERPRIRMRTSSSGCRSVGLRKVLTFARRASMPATIPWRRVRRKDFLMVCSFLAVIRGQRIWIRPAALAASPISNWDS